MPQRLIRPLHGSRKRKIEHIRSTLLKFHIAELIKYKYVVTFVKDGLMIHRGQWAVARPAYILDACFRKLFTYIGDNRKIIHRKHSVIHTAQLFRCTALITFMLLCLRHITAGCILLPIKQLVYKSAGKILVHLEIAQLQLKRVYRMPPASECRYNVCLIVCLPAVKKYSHSSTIIFT